MSAALITLALAAAQPAMPGEAASPPVASKLFVLIGAAQCSQARLRLPLETLAVRLTRDRRTSRVVIDWPAEPERNLDMMGRPSPILAALEVQAPPRALAALSRRIGNHLSAICPASIYRVAERALLRPARTWPLGQPSPGGKIINTVVRKVGVSQETFVHEWTQIHAPLSLAWRSAAAVPAARYVQNLVMAQPGGGAPELAGIGEIETSAPMSDAIREARMKTAQHASVFSDPPRGATFRADEIILKDR